MSLTNKKNHILMYLITLARSVYFFFFRLFSFVVIFYFINTPGWKSYALTLAIAVNLVLVFSSFLKNFLFNLIKNKTLLVLLLGIQAFCYLFLLLIYLSDRSVSNVLFLALFLLLLFVNNIELMVFDKAIPLFFDEKRNYALALNRFSLSISFILAPLCIAYFMDKNLIKESIFFLSGLACLLYALTLVPIRISKLTRYELDVENKKDDGFSRIFLFELLLFSQLTFIWTNFCSILIVPYFVGTLSKILIGILISIAGLGSLIGNFILILLSQSNKIELINRISFILSSLLFGGIFLINTGYLYYILFGALSITTQVNYGIAQFRAQSHLSADRLGSFIVLRQAINALVVIIICAIVFTVPVNFKWIMKITLVSWTMTMLTLFITSHLIVRQNKDIIK